MKMELIVSVIEPHEYDSWDEMISNSRQGSLYHTSAWKRTIDEAYDPAHQLLVGCSDDHGLIGGCVALARTRLSSPTAVTPLLTPYAGFVVSERAAGDVEDEVLSALGKWMSDHFKYQNLINGPGLEDVRPLQHAGYSVTPRYTYHLNLKLPPEELWMSFDDSVRRQIKKGEKADFEISDTMDCGSAYEMLKQTFERRRQKCPVSFKLFEAVCTGDALRDYREVLCAYRDNQLIGYIILLKHQRTIYYGVASTGEQFLSTGASSFLIWEAIKLHANQEYNTLDFVGANVPSIARFKEGFHPRLVMHFQAERYGKAYMKIGKTLSRMLKK